MNIDEIKNQYLWHGYIPRVDPPSWLSKEILNSAGSYDVRAASDLTDTVFDRISAKCQNAPLVPLSGGWDSRFILAALLDRFEPKEIITVTFGTKGQYDYDIANEIARSVGTRHFNIDTLSVNVSWENLIDSVTLAPLVRPIDCFFNQQILSLASELSADTWSGFIGDLINGGHYKSLRGYNSLESFNSSFAHNNKVANLSSSNFRPRYLDQNSSELSFELLFLLYRVVQYTSPTVLSQPMLGWTYKYPNVFSSNCNVITPFTDEHWAGYWLGAPEHSKLNQSLFKSLFEFKYPDLFKMPSKETLGHNKSKTILITLDKAKNFASKSWQKSFHKYRKRNPKMANYFDIAEVIATHPEWSKIAVNAVDYISDNQIAPWIPVRDIIREHLRRERNHSEALVVLMGLALNHAAGNLQENIFSSGANL